MISQVEDDVKDWVVQEDKQDLQSQSSIRTTTARTLRHCIQSDSSSLATQSAPTQSGRKITSLRWVNQDIDVNSNYALFTSQSTCFEEAMKDEN